MKICFFCSSSDNLDRTYYTIAEQIIIELRNRHWTLVSGGTKLGLMRLLVENAKKYEVESIGIMPSFFSQRDILNFDNTQLILSKNLSDRKRKLIEISDAFVVLPGGYGTLDEMFEIITLKLTNVTNKPIILFNHNNFYDELLIFLEKIYKENFSHIKNDNLFKIFNNSHEIFNYLENIKSRV